MTDFRKPLDRTGKAASNLITNEAQTLPNRQVRVIVPEFGAFFAESLIVKDAANDRVLTPFVEYAPADIYYHPTMEYGKGIYAEIVLYNTEVSNNVIITYQAVGGMYSVNRKNIFAALDEIDLDDRPVGYSEIIGRPHYLSPGPHQHDTGDTYGWEYIQRALDNVTSGLIQGRQSTYDKILSDIQTEYSLLKDQNTSITAQLQAHISDFNNPHELSAGQINVFTIPETDFILQSLYNTFNTRGNSIITRTTNHDSDKGNPHQLTPGQINAYTTAEFNAKLADAISKLASGSDGSWVYLFSGTVNRPDPIYPDNPQPRSSWTWNNPYSKAVIVSNSMAGQGNQGVYQSGYVNGQLISEAFNYQSSDSDNKTIQGIFKVPVGGSLTIYSNHWSSNGDFSFEDAPPGRFLAFGFVLNGS